MHDNHDGSVSTPPLTTNLGNGTILAVRGELKRYMPSPTVAKSPSNPTLSQRRPSKVDQQQHYPHPNPNEVIAKSPFDQIETEIQGTLQSLNQKELAERTSRLPHQRHRRQNASLDSLRLHMDIPSPKVLHRPTKSAESTPAPFRASAKMRQSMNLDKLRTDRKSLQEAMARKSVSFADFLGTDKPLPKVPQLSVGFEEKPLRISTDICPPAPEPQRSERTQSRSSSDLSSNDYFATKRVTRLSLNVYEGFFVIKLKVRGEVVAIKFPHSMLHGNSPNPLGTVLVRQMQEKFHAKMPKYVTLSPEVRFKYRDEDGDEILIVSDEDLRTAFETECSFEKRCLNVELAS